MTGRPRAARAALAAILLAAVSLGCAAGTARVRHLEDGSWECRASGIVWGRATIAAVVREHLVTTPGAKQEAQDEMLDACAAIRGGAGSEGVWATVGAAIGAAAGFVASHFLW